ncbi:MAG: ABC transporter permease [Bdellovibrionales bacterium]|nr:ABC transporter permease [Bdellovibrionales bacterium]
MDFASFVGIRYLRSKKGNAFLSLITFLSMAGVAIGVATLIVILSVMDGFEGALKGRLSTGDFHILAIRGQEREDPHFNFPDSKVAELFGADSRLQAVNPVLATEAIIKAGKKVSGLQLRGITDSHAHSLKNQLVEAAGGSPRLLSGIWLGQELAFNLNVLPGDRVQIISPVETEGPLESVPRMRVFQVEGVYASGIPEKDLHTAYAPVASVEEFLGRRGVVNQVEFRVDHFENSVPVAEKVRALLGEEFLVKDWEQLNAHLFSSLKLERITMFVILTMIVIVASFNIVTSLRMTVMEKRRDISILQAMGARRRQIANVFLVQGAVIGGTGVVLGLGLGLLLCWLLARYPMIQLPDVFYDRSLPVSVSPLFVAFVVLVAFLIVVLASLSPARAAAKIPPLEGIREV